MTSSVVTLPAAGRRLRPVVALAVAASVLALSVGLLFVRGWRPLDEAASVDPAPVPASMPASAEIEEQMGVRFTAVVLTGSEGIVEVRYQVLDASKAGALHAEGTAPIVTVGGVTLDQPALDGHAHSATPVAGRAGFGLLANVGHVVSRGDTVSLRVGELHLDGIVVE